MLTSKGSTSSNIDIEYHLQVATRAFDANKTVLCDKHMSICRRLCYFHTLVMPAACFGAGPRAIHAVSKIDVHPRKLVRNIVGPRPQTNWDSRWHIILHVLTEKIKLFCSTIRCSYVDNIVLATTLIFHGTLYIYLQQMGYKGSTLDTNGPCNSGKAARCMAIET